MDGWMTHRYAMRDRARLDRVWIAVGEVFGHVACVCVSIDVGFGCVRIWVVWVVVYGCVCVCVCVRACVRACAWVAL